MADQFCCAIVLCAGLIFIATDRWLQFSGKFVIFGRVLGVFSSVIMSVKEFDLAGEVFTNSIQESSHNVVAATSKKAVAANKRSRSSKTKPTEVNNNKEDYVPTKRVKQGGESKTCQALNVDDPREGTSRMDPQPDGLDTVEELLQSSEQEEQELCDDDSDGELLEELQQLYDTAVEEVGPPIDGKLKDLVNNLFTHHLTDDRQKNLHDKHLRPENCPTMVNPRVNQEVWDILPSNARMMDVNISRVGAKLAKSAAPVSRLVDLLFLIKSKVKNVPEISDAIRLATDALALQAGALHELNIQRRSLLKKDLPTKVIKISSKIKQESALLFGENFVQCLKEASEGEKLGLATKASSFSLRQNRYQPTTGHSFRAVKQPNFQPRHYQQGEGKWGVSRKFKQSQALPYYKQFYNPQKKPAVQPFRRWRENQQQRGK